MFGKIIFLVDLTKILAGEIIGFFKNLRTENPNKEKLFKLQNFAQKLGRRTSENLLVVSLTNSNFIVNIEGLFGKYFNLKGYNVHFLSNFREKRAVEAFKAIGGNVIYHNFLYLKKGLGFLFKKLPKVENAEELKNFSYKGINIGIAVYSTVSRKLKIGELDFEDRETKKTVRRYLWRSAVYSEVAEDLIDALKPDLILALEKGYIGNSEIFNLAVEKGVDFVQWIGCQTPNSLIFKRYNKDNRREHAFSVSQKVWRQFLQRPWQEGWKNEVYEIFEQGYQRGEWFRYNRLMENTRMMGREEFMKKYNLDSSKKIAVLFSHIMWDANLFYGEDLFGRGFGEWLTESVKVMAKNKNVNWLLKIHPANRYKHRFEKIEGDYSEIRTLKKTFGEIPGNIKLIYPEDEINPYSLFKIIDYAITVRGTIGMEFPCFGVPVLTAGTGRYSGRGFSIDSGSREEYLARLSRIEEIPPLGKEEIKKAVLHALIVFKLRPLKFQSYKEKFVGDEMDLDILIRNPQEGTDFIKFVDWAVNSKEEDFLNEL